MVEFSIKDNLEKLFEKLEEFLVSKTVVGEMIQVGETTLIPIVSVNFGLGTGGGDGQDEKNNKGYGGGAGIGARLSPTAMVVVRGEHIQVLPLNKQNSLEKLVDMVPEIVKKIQEGCCLSGKKKEEQV